jgi:hypothetical protein
MHDYDRLSAEMDSLLGTDENPRTAPLSECERQGADQTEQRLAVLGKLSRGRITSPITPGAGLYGSTPSPSAWIDSATGQQVAVLAPQAADGIFALRG